MGFNGGLIGFTGDLVRFHGIYTLVNKRLHHYGTSSGLMGKSTINGPCSIAMFVYQKSE